MLVVIAIIGILAALLLPVLEQSKARAKQIECVSNLREIGLAAHIFANDHSGKFPTQVSTNDGGSMEFVTAGYQIINHRFYFSFQHFRPLAGILSTPNLLACPADLERWPTTNFNQFNNSNLSYVIGLGADPNIPNSILAADRDLPSCHHLPPNPTIGHVFDTTNPPGPPPYWPDGTDAVHQRKGNILFSDGHAEESGDANFLSEMTVSEPLVYPDVPTSPGVPSWSSFNKSASPVYPGGTTSQPKTAGQNGRANTVGTSGSPIAQVSPAASQPTSPSGIQSEPNRFASKASQKYIRHPCRTN